MSRHRSPAEDRDARADDRDDAARVRDAASDERDTDADRRDRRADGRGTAVRDGTRELLDRFQRLRRDVLDRLPDPGPAGPAVDRAAVARLLDEFEHALHDELHRHRVGRRNADDDRRSSADDRRGSRRDRTHADQDRSLAARDRHQAAVEQEQATGPVGDAGPVAPVPSAVDHSGRALAESRERIAGSRARIEAAQRGSPGAVPAPRPATGDGP